MKSKLPQLSIFFPFWNEEKNIEAVTLKALEIAPKVADKWEILLIDDGSSDKTLQIAQKLENEHKNVRTISHIPNRGYGAALKSGFEHSKYRYIVFTDGDLQFDFSQVERFVEKIEDADIVIGYREKRRDPFKRNIFATLLKIWDFVFFHFFYKDIDCGFKMFKKDNLDKIMPLRSEGAMITTEILAKAKAKNLKIKEVGVTHLPRKYGEQSGGNPSVIIRAMLETFILFWDIRYKRF